MNLVDSLKQEVAEDSRVIRNISPVVDVSNENIFNQTNATGDTTTVLEHFTSDVPDEELIRRLEGMHSYISIPFNETVKKYMVLYSEKMAGAMGRILGDAKLYFPYFESIFSNYNIPLELKYMSIIESSLKAKAVSRAGAKGMWQFMYATGKSYGLEINSYVDERLDPWKAADAAARFLQDAYNIFEDWGLAICSYNCGINNVNRAINAAGSSDFWKIYPYLPRETRGYLPAFVGAMYATVYHKEYNITPGKNPMPEPIDTIEIHRQLHFKQIEEIVGVPHDLLDMLNPQYLHQIIPGNCGTYVLRLPHEWALKFAERNNDELYTYKEEELFGKAILKAPEDLNANTYIQGQSSHKKQSSIYRVKAGDSLGKIAARNGVTVEQLRRANKIKGSIIRPGQKIVIPGKSGGKRRRR